MADEAQQRRAWRGLVELARGCFSSPIFLIFGALLDGWVTAPGRRTITAMICAVDPEGERAHDAYHRFLRAARWSTNALWKVLVLHLVDVFAPVGTLVLDCDDTLYKKSGRKICGAGSFRDAPPRTGKPGRPRKKGKRLQTPEEMARTLKDDKFTEVRVDFRGTERDLLVWSRPVLWYTTDPEHLVFLVIVRGPEHAMRDDFFFTTDLDASPGDVASLLCRPLEHRVREPRGEAVPSRRRPPELEGHGSRTCRLVVVVALRGDLDLVHPDVRDDRHLDHPALVPEEGDAELSRRACRVATLLVVRPNFSRVIFQAAQPENDRRSARRAYRTRAA